jgi:hypothetical protein
MAEATTWAGAMNSSYPPLRVTRMASVRSSLRVALTACPSCFPRPASSAVRDSIIASLRAVGSLTTRALRSAQVEVARQAVNRPIVRCNFMGRFQRRVSCHYPW